MVPAGLTLLLAALLLAPRPAAAGTQDRECVVAKQQQGVEPNIRATNQENTTVRCSHGSYCYGLWEIKKEEEIHLVQQGCWPHNGSQQHCHDDHCLVTTPPSQMARREYRFCCCSRDLCNFNFSHSPTLGRSAAGPTPALHPLPQGEMLVIAVVAVALALLLMGALLLGYCLLKGNYKQSGLNPGVMEAAISQPVDLEDLKLLECIGRGRYGSVFRAVLNQRTVAVKVVSGHHHFATECSVYLLPLLQQHENMAAFLGADERTSEGRTEYLLVMEYYPLGCLGSFLSLHAPDWPSCCRMVQSATCGLAFLHTELHQGDLYKPAVCHRDINSRNILVRGDFSCVLSDFGLSMTLTHTGLPPQGEEEHCAISEAGTLRYMAPEVLEGAVNLKDCESALKQVDVYALGLVYWETFRRCPDLYPTGDGAPEYLMVFQEELGKQPSFQDMQRLVSRDKQRPSFPWEDSSLAVQALRDTIQECWDQDAEARLTSQCAAQRLADLLAPSTRSPALYSHRNLAADFSYIEDQVGVVRNITGDGYSAAISGTKGGMGMEKNRNTINYQLQQAQVRLSPEESDVTLFSTISDSGGPLASGPVLLQLTQEDLEATKLDPKEVQRGGVGIRRDAPFPSALLPLPKQQNLPQRPSSLLLPPKPRQAGPRNTTLREVETGFTKINKVSVTVTTAPHQVTTVTRSIPGGGGARAQAVRLVANGYRGGVVANLVEGGGGRSNPAGPQEEEEREVEGGEDSCQSVLTSSPDEHAPLLHHRHPNSGTNTNKSIIQQPALRSQVMLESLDKHLALPTMPLASPFKHVAPPPGPPAPGPPACLLSGAPDPALGSSSASASASPPSEGRAAQRPSSLDLSFSSSSSSGDKIKRRVKTPYILKKPRPATWVVSMETSLDSEINNYNSSNPNSFPKFNQSKSSMAIFMVGGMTSDPS